MRALKLFPFMICAILLFVGLSGRPPKAVIASDKPNVDEIITKHLNSIGSNEARAAIRSRVIAGVTHVEFRSRGFAQIDGGAVLASDGPKSIVTMRFEASQYPYEKIGYNGNTVTAYQIHPGEFTSLGSFVRSYPETFKEGLLGGTLSSAWPLFDLSVRKPRLEYAGTKKINSRPVIELRYQPRGGADLKISVFLDAETFQHVRTFYQKIISAQIGRTVNESARNPETRYELTEDFSDFKVENGLTLPHVYKVRLVQQGAGTQVSEWTMNLLKFTFNQPLNPQDFDVSKE